MSPSARFAVGNQVLAACSLLLATAAVVGSGLLTWLWLVFGACFTVLAWLWVRSQRASREGSAAPGRRP